MNHTADENDNVQPCYSSHMILLQLPCIPNPNHLSCVLYQIERDK